MSTGWIKLHRQIYENPRSSDPDWMAVWIYLLSNAAHKPVDAIWRGQRISLMPGQLITGRHAISAKTGVNASKVQRVINILKIDQQIDQRTSNVSSLISILNWRQYQQDDQPSDQQVISQRSASDQPVITNKNIKNDKNEKNEKNLENPPQKPPTGGGESGEEILILESPPADETKPKAKKPPKNEEYRLRIGALFRRKPNTAWSERETDALRKLEITESDMETIEQYYRSGCEYCRRDVKTLLNNWPGEVDRAKLYFERNGKLHVSTREPEPLEEDAPAGWRNILFDLKETAYTHPDFADIDAEIDHRKWPALKKTVRRAIVDEANRRKTAPISPPDNETYIEVATGTTKRF